MTASAPRPNIAPLLLDYFCAKTDDQIDDAIDAITDFLDNNPPADDTLELMLRACAADPRFNYAMRAYASRD
jgi:hypothetical protein